MRSKALVALGRVVLSKRERVMALEPYDRGLIGTTLRYPYEVRHARDYFGEIPDLTPAPELLRLAAHILDSKTASFAPAGCRSPSKVLPCRAGPSISSRRCAGASRRTRNNRPPHARLPPSQRANGRECQNLPNHTQDRRAHFGAPRRAQPAIPFRGSEYDRSDETHALRRLHPQIDRA